MINSIAPNDAYFKRRLDDTPEIPAAPEPDGIQYRCHVSTSIRSRAARFGGMV